MAGATGLEPATFRLEGDNQTTPARSSNAGHVDDHRDLIGFNDNQWSPARRWSLISAICTNSQGLKYKILPKRRSPSADWPGRGFGVCRFRRHAMAFTPCASPMPRSRAATNRYPGRNFRDIRGLSPARFLYVPPVGAWVYPQEMGRTCISKGLFASRPHATRKQLAPRAPGANLPA